MNPKPLSSLNHFTVPVAILCLLRLSALRNEEGAVRQQLRRRDAQLWSNGRSTRAASVGTVPAGEGVGFERRRTQRPGNQLPNCLLGSGHLEFFADEDVVWPVDGDHVDVVVAAAQQRHT